MTFSLHWSKFVIESEVTELRVSSFSNMHQVRWRRVLCSVPYLTFGHEFWVAAGLLQALL